VYTPRVYRVYGQGVHPSATAVYTLYTPHYKGGCTVYKRRHTQHVQAATAEKDARHAVYSVEMACKAYLSRVRGGKPS
jgi:hypothetical protein